MINSIFRICRTEVRKIMLWLNMRWNALGYNGHRLTGTRHIKTIHAYLGEQTPMAPRLFFPFSSSFSSCSFVYLVDTCGIKPLSSVEIILYQKLKNCMSSQANICMLQLPTLHEDGQWHVWWLPNCLWLWSPLANQLLAVIWQGNY